MKVMDPVGRGLCAGWSGLRVMEGVMQKLRLLLQFLRILFTAGLVQHHMVQMTVLGRWYILRLPAVFPNSGFQNLKLVINIVMLRNYVFWNIVLEVLSLHLWNVLYSQHPYDSPYGLNCLLTRFSNKSPIILLGRIQVRPVFLLRSAPLF